MFARVISLTARHRSDYGIFRATACGKKRDSDRGTSGVGNMTNGFGRRQSARDATACPVEPAAARRRPAPAAYPQRILLTIARQGNSAGNLLPALRSALPAVPVHDVAPDGSGMAPVDDNYRFLGVLQPARHAGGDTFVFTNTGADCYRLN